MFASTMPNSPITVTLPWDADKQSEQKFRYLLAALLLLSLVFSLVVYNTTLEEPLPTKQAEIPERLVKLVLEQKKREVVKTPPPPPKVEPKPEPEKPKEKPPEVKPEIAAKTISKVPPKPQGNREDARNKARMNLAVFDDMADLKTAATGKKLDSNKLSSDTGKAESIKRDMIVNNARSSSGGVQVGKASTNVGGAGLSGGGSTQVSSNLSAKRDAQYQASTQGMVAERPAENIERFMDMNKSAFFAMYNRALRKAPAMQGEVIFEITIAPSGKVEAVAIVSSQLNNAALEKKLMRKIRSINFNAMDVATWKNHYRINFIPT